MLRYIIFSVFLLVATLALIEAITPSPIHMDPACGNRCIEAKLTGSRYFQCIRKCWEGVVMQKPS